MKKLATCIVAITGFIGTSAFAADMGVKAPPAPPPPPVWTGWYVGVNLGASMGNVKTDFNAAPVTVATNIPAIPGNHSFNTPGFGGTNTESPDGFIGGGQIGYNWQFSPLWVVGVEADFQGALEKDHNTLTNPFSFSPCTGGSAVTCPVTGSTVLDYSTKIEWFGTARLRAGYVWGNGNVFSYFTGGLAYAKIDVEGTSTTFGTISGASPPFSTAFSSPFSTIRGIGHSDTRAGWTLGYGTEGRLAMPGWTWRVESLYMDFGHLNDTDDVMQLIPCKGCGVTGVTGGQTFTNTHFTDWILRGGLSYQFH